MNEPIQHWMTRETLDTVEEQRELKREGRLTQRDSKRLSGKIQRQCRRDKNNYIKGICREIEEHQSAHETRDLYRKVRELSRKIISKAFTIEDKDGKILWEDQRIIERWRQYCEELYNDDAERAQQQGGEMHCELEPDVLLSKVEEAIKHLKLNKAPGADGISAELIKAMADVAGGTKIVQDICNKVWRSGLWPRDWVNSMFIPIHKKGSTRKYGNYRTISIVSHASKNT